MTLIPTENITKNYGFVIDNRKCIGCHACSVACKSENEVPLSVNRTWVKYVDAGIFPHTRRHFQVTRCNHCANPPCVRICPTAAMYQRDDGIVEFDNSICIGCKACLQACPYDAIYIDPETHTAAKCHYCAHRTDIGLEPACVVVCPEQAIISGDMNDPDSQISHLLTTEKVTVRKPEQGTAPKLFYINGNDVTLHPTATERTPETFMWADVQPLHHNMPSPTPPRPSLWQQLSGPNTHTHTSGAVLRAPQAQSYPQAGPIQIAGNIAEHMVQVAYNAQHKIPWHWQVPAYLLTKGIAAGIFMLLSLGWTFGFLPYSPTIALAGSSLSLLFLLLTTVLLVADLEQPKRFLYLLIRPQWKSWLVRGAFALIAFSTLIGMWWLLELFFRANTSPTLAIIRFALLTLGLPFAILTAIYTAFLFAQAEGRDLWQSSLLPFHMLTQSLIAGTATLLLLDLFLPTPSRFAGTVALLLIFFLLLDTFITLTGEFGIPHASEVAAQAAHAITHGHYRQHFWWGNLTLGHVLPFALWLIFLLTRQPQLLPLAGISALSGLFIYEYIFVMAPQEIPNS